MTEAEWLAWTDAAPLLKYLEGKVSDRKLRLFAVACARNVWNELPVDGYREAVLVTECFADGRASVRELAAASEMVRNDYERRVYSGKTADACLAVFSTSYCTVEDQSAMASAIGAATWAPKVLARTVPFSAATEMVCRTVHDVFGNPFRPVAFEPRWRTSDVTHLARAIYDDRAFDRMPILTDALMDAGCADEQIIGHCRGDRPHVRGCWVVDLVLGKS